MVFLSLKISLPWWCEMIRGLSDERNRGEQLKPCDDFGEPPCLLMEDAWCWLGPVHHTVRLRCTGLWLPGVYHLVRDSDKSTHATIMSSLRRLYVTLDTHETAARKERAKTSEQETNKKTPKRYVFYLVFLSFGLESMEKIPTANANHVAHFLAVSRPLSPLTFAPTLCSRN